MKKRLEAELISIAHRILKLKSKSELNQLYVESRKLYETLSVLKFVEDNIHAIQPAISEKDIEKMIDHSTIIIDKEIVAGEVNEEVSDNEILDADETKLIDAEPELNLSIEKENLDIESGTDDVSAEKNDMEELLVLEDQSNVKPTFSFEPEMDYSAEFVKKENPDTETISFEKKSELAFEKPESPKVQQISFEELLGHQIEEPQFEKKIEKKATLNEVLGKNANFGLNDRIGFVKNLFDGSDEDFDKVLSQIGTMADADEVKAFLSELIKPDYNNWENKEDYEARFMEIVLNRFV